MKSRFEHKEAQPSFAETIAYASGEGANSLTMNGIWAFSLLFYTQALGLDYKLAGLALSISVFWDAVTDPVMGYISDHTRSRFGRRHPYILIGGVFLAVSFYFLWAIPSVIITSGLLFWYLLFVNILIRTAVTVFNIPYLALGFELCQDYHGRSRLQGARYVANMIANLLGPALAWTLFFKDTGTIQSTSVPANYVRMGSVFAIATLVIVLVVTVATRKHIVDSKHDQNTENQLTSFFKDTREILRDKYSLILYAFYGVLMQGNVLVASLQMYLYIYYMNFSSVQKSLAHGLAMVGFAIGSFLSSIMARRIDKKPTVIMGAAISVFGNLALAVLFLSGWVRPGATVALGGIEIPYAIMVFILFHAGYWMGNGIMGPMTFSMVADTSEINKIKTGVQKDGSYSAMFSFLIKLASSVGLLLTGGCLGWIGFVSGGASQTPAAIENLAIATFFSGILFAILAVGALWRYPVNKAFMERIKNGKDML